MGKLEEFRKFVLDTLDENDATSLCSPEDIKRFGSDDKYAQCFLQQSAMNFQEGYNMVQQCLMWRNNFGVSKITEDSLDKKLLETGLFYMRGRSLKGSRILRAKICKCVRGAFPPRSLQQVFVYLLEKHSAENHTPIVILFDLTNTGVKHIDLDLVRFIISCFKIYYPMMLDMILAFDMPWVMNAAWKLIKTWLGPEASDKVGFVDTVSISRYVGKEQLPTHMGGKDNYVFDGKLFSFIEEESGEVANVTESPPSSTGAMEVKDGLFITPAEEIVFDLNELVSDTCQRIRLKNTGQKTMAYKFKSTSPEKFSVRPGMGTLPARNEISVRVSLTSEALSSNSVSEDKFLLLYRFLEQPISCGIREFWRSSSNNENTYSHKIRCSIFPSLHGTPMIQAVQTNPKSLIAAPQQREFPTLVKTLYDNQALLLRNVKIVAAFVLIVMLINVINLILLINRFK